MTLAQLLKDVARGGAEASLNDLFDVFQLPNDESTLAKVGLVAQKIKELDCRMIPDIDRGELTSTRRVIFAHSDLVTGELVKSELVKRESTGLELKSSLLFDHNRFAAEAKATKEQLRSEGVLHSCLKTIAAFLTSNGGILYIGVNDGGKAVGIEYDFPYTSSNPDKSKCDAWELALRAYIRDRFREGENVNDYVDCDIVEFEAKMVARIRVSPRKKISFLREKDGFALYRRQGNQTIRVTIDQFEEFLIFRRSLSE